ncbi:MAG: hypothetical protein LUF87_03280 [Alistipes sp.]|nr:hypothetical protein [Alistipes sp.]
MRKISIDQFAILIDTFPETASFGMEIQLGFKASPKERLIAATFKYIFETENKKPVIILEVSCYFEVEENSWKEFKNKKEIVIPRGLLCHMAVHTVGACRGILHCRTESTPFNSFILPPINVESMIDEDMVLPLEEK